MTLSTELIRAESSALGWTSCLRIFLISMRAFPSFGSRCLLRGELGHTILREIICLCECHTLNDFNFCSRRELWAPYPFRRTLLAVAIRAVPPCWDVRLDPLSLFLFYRVFVLCELVRARNIAFFVFVSSFNIFYACGSLRIGSSVLDYFFRILTLLVLVVHM